MNILDLLLADGHNLKKVSSTNGGEWAGPCPDCGGTDRFRVWPYECGGRYWCRQCERSGDTIQYLRDFRGKGYVEACRYLGSQPNPQVFSTMLHRGSNSTFVPREASEPGSTWQTTALEYVKECQMLLWSSSGAGMRDFLRKEKGLSNESSFFAKLGLNLQDIYLERSAWGLRDEFRENGKPRKLWIPAGLIIPCMDNGIIVRIRVRRSNPDNERRYVIVSGSDSRPMTYGMDKKTVVVVESELDGLLLKQTAGDLVGVVALGSAQAKPDRQTHEALQKADKILVSLDSDDAGGRAAWSHWPKTYGSKVKRWPCIFGKDPSASWSNGLDLRSWILAGMDDIILL